MVVDLENFELQSPTLEGKVIESEIMMKTRERILRITMRRMASFRRIRMDKIEEEIREELAADYARLAAANERYYDGEETALADPDVSALEQTIEKNLYYARSYKRDLGMVY